MAHYDLAWYVNSGDQATTGYYAITKRPQNTAVTAGQIARQFTTPTVNNERVFVCIVAGTTANTTDATWTLTRGAKVTDGTATWQECTGVAALNGDITNTVNWTQAKAIGNPSIGAIIKRNSGASYHICSTTGTLGASEPAFSDTAGVTTTDNTVTWTCIGPVGNFTNGMAPAPRINIPTGSSYFIYGNYCYVADTHAESQTTAISISPFGTATATAAAKIICHSQTGSYPPTPSDLRIGATVSTTANQNISVVGGGVQYWYGIIFKAGVGVSSGSVNILVSTPHAIFDNCSFQIHCTFSGSGITFGSSVTCYILLNNCTLRFGHTGHSCNLSNGTFLIWQNTAPGLIADSAIPQYFFNLNSIGDYSMFLIEGVDLSTYTGTLVSYANPMSGNFVFKDCKLHASVTPTLPSNSSQASYTQFINSTSDTTHYKSSRYCTEGNEVTETTITRVNGATEPTNIHVSRKITSSTMAYWQRPYRAEPYAVWNNTVGSSVVVSVHGTLSSLTVPNDDEIWLELAYSGSSSSTLGTVTTTTKTNPLASGTPVPTDSSTWNGTTFVTFSEAVAVGTTLSNGNRTATHINTSSNCGTYSVDFRTTGKYYFEIAIGSINATSGWAETIGAITTSGSINSGSVANYFMVHTSTGQPYSNGSTQGASLGAPVAGDVLSYALDLTARLGWVRKNGGNWNASGTANPATGVGGHPLYATVGYAPSVVFAQNNASAGGNYTLNGGQVAYANAAPSGYGNWPTSWTPFKLTKTITPGLPGYIHARVRVGKPSTVYYIDPKIELT